MRIGAALAKQLAPGDCIELSGDLGAGKTLLVRGMAQALGSGDEVHSPSFTLMNQYKTPALVIHHYDFYRLSEPGIMAGQLAESIQDPGVVTVVEWGQTVNSVLPAQRRVVAITAIGQKRRQLVLSGWQPLNSQDPAANTITRL